VLKKEGNAYSSNLNWGKHRRKINQKNQEFLARNPKLARLLQ